MSTNKIKKNPKKTCLTCIYDLDLFSLINDSEIHPQPVRCKYYLISLFHNNVRSLKKNLDNLQTHLLDELHYNFSVIGVTETRINQTEISDSNPAFQNCNFEYVPTPQAAGGVGMYIGNALNYTIIEKCTND
jgi:hypothetical protein